MKYHSQSVNIDGYDLDSQLELKCYQHLNYGLSGSDYIVKAHTEVIVLVPPGNVISPNNKFRAITWKPDFFIYRTDKVVNQANLIVEVKGYETTDFLLRMNLASRLDIWNRIIFCYKSAQAAYASKMRRYGATVTHPALLSTVALQKLVEIEHGKH